MIVTIDHKDYVLTPTAVIPVGPWEPVATAWTKQAKRQTLAGAGNTIGGASPPLCESYPAPAI